VIVNGKIIEDWPNKQIGPVVKYSRRKDVQDLINWFMNKDLVKWAKLLDNDLPLQLILMKVGLIGDAA
jgi:hypothetical protein